MRAMKLHLKTYTWRRVCSIVTLTGVLLASACPAMAGGSRIRCFVDAKGVTNCTNIGTGRAASAKPQTLELAQKPVSTGVEAVAQASSTPPAAQAAPTPTPTPPAATTGQGRATYVYHYKQSNGVTQLTNVPNRSLTLISTSVYQSFEKGWTGSLFKTANWKLNHDAFNEAILSMATAQSVDPALVRAVIHAESSFNPTAVSRTGAMGLMQLMPGTAARFGVANAFDPQENIRGGVTYLRFLLDKFNGDVRLAAAGYNAGEGAVMKYGGVPPYSETTEYVARVLDLHGKYRGEH